MRCAYLDLGQHPDTLKDKLYGCDAVAFDIRQDDLTLDYLKQVNAQGFAPWVYAADAWHDDLTGPAFADLYSKRLEAIAPGTQPTLPGVVLDLETHDVGWLLRCLARWRQHRPHRATVWLLEAFQGGLFSPTDVALIMHTGVSVGPSLYTGSMAPLDPLEVWTNLASAGFPMRALVGLYDAATLTTASAWSGFAFTQGRLR